MAWFSLICSSAPTLNVNEPAGLRVGVSPALCVKFWIFMELPAPVINPFWNVRLIGAFGAPLALKIAFCTKDPLMTFAVMDEVEPSGANVITSPWLLLSAICPKLIPWLSVISALWMMLTDAEPMVVVACACGIIIINAVQTERLFKK